MTLPGVVPSPPGFNYPEVLAGSIKGTDEPKWRTTMPKVATVKLFWRRSPSSDIAKVKLVMTHNGTETTTEIGVEVEEFVLDIVANSSFGYKIESIDAEGNVATSVVYSLTLGDLEAPLPATDLGHEILSVRDA